jgi:hypothetical protein
MDNPISKSPVFMAGFFCFQINDDWLRALPELLFQAAQVSP